MQPARGGEVELLRIAANFEDNGRKSLQLGRLLRDPQRIDQLWRLGDQQVVRRDAEAGAQARRIRHARFVEDFSRADPQQRRPARRPRQQKSGQRQDKTAGRAGVAGLRAVDFRQRRKRQAAAKGGIETRRPGGQAGGIDNRAAMTPQHHSLALIRMSDRRLQPLGQRALDLRDFAAQGKNSRLRHGGTRHDDMPSR